MTEALEQIRFTADVVALTPDGRVLLIERGWPPFQGAWALPGVHGDPGVTSRDAAARKLEEETGVRVDAADLLQLGAWDTPGRDPRGRYVTVAYLAFDEATRAGHDPQAWLDAYDAARAKAKNAAAQNTAAPAEPAGAPE
jgi:8-oxo-dGTP diphosphatase